jgi:hypothetical protein
MWDTSVICGLTKCIIAVSDFAHEHRQERILIGVRSLITGTNMKTGPELPLFSSLKTLKLNAIYEITRTLLVQSQGGCVGLRTQPVFCSIKSRLSKSIAR